MTYLGTASFFALLFLTGCMPKSGPTSSTLPNVLIILTDDQGYGDVASYGATDIETPNIDALAEQGVRFTQFYADAPVCAPSRAALLTGKTPLNAGVTKNGYVSGTDVVDGLPPEQITIAERLRDAGYRTALIGKWHLGYHPTVLPKTQGFDFTFGHINGAIDNYSHNFYWSDPFYHDLYKNGQEVFFDGQYYQDLMVEHAAEFFDLPNDRPFFMYYATNAPHYPFQPDAKWASHYADKGMDKPRERYAAYVSSMDQRIGELIKLLKRRGLYDDTIIIFQSDNGPSSEARAGFNSGSTMGLRGAKGSLFEGGIRVPAILVSPDKRFAGQVREQLVTSTDWFPTILDMLNLSDTEFDFDGRSILPILADKSQPSQHDDYVWSSGVSIAVRQGDWKLLIKTLDTTALPNAAQATMVEGPFLVDLKKDPAETTNMAASNPKKVRALMALIPPNAE